MLGFVVGSVVGLAARRMALQDCGRDFANIVGWFVMLAIWGGLATGGQL